MNELSANGVALTKSDMARIETTTESAEGLPARVYVKPEFFELERQTLFRNGWVAAAFEQDVPEPGDVFPTTVAGWELLFVRGRDGQVRCFHNICRHRGMKLVREPKKKRQNLPCAWHCWTYDLEGKLISTPNLGGPKVSDVEGIDKTCLGLLPVRCEQWWNFLFVNIDDNAPPLAEHMAPLDARIENFDRRELVCSNAGFSFDYAGNWKVLIEGGIEDYHFPWVHPQLMPQGEFRPEIGGSCYAGISSRPANPGEPAKLVGKQLGSSESKVLPKFSHFADPEKVEMGVYMAIPSAVVALNGDHAVTSLFVPTAHNHTQARRLFHFIGEDAALGPDYAEARDNIISAWRNISEQDASYVEEVHNMSHVREALNLGTRFSPFWETAVHHFQVMIAQRTQA